MNFSEGLTLKDDLFVGFYFGKFAIGKILYRELQIQIQIWMNLASTVYNLALWFYTKTRKKFDFQVFCEPQIYFQTNFPTHYYKNQNFPK